MVDTRKAAPLHKMHFQKLHINCRKQARGDPASQLEGGGGTGGVIVMRIWQFAKLATRWILNVEKVYCCCVRSVSLFPVLRKFTYAICVPLRQMLLQLLGPLRQPLVLPPLQFTVRTQVLSVSLMIFY